MTTGEGGMVTSHDAALADAMKVLCLHGISKDAWNRYSDKGKWSYEVLRPGFKYNLSDLQSAIGIHQFRKLDGFTMARTKYAQLYNELLAGVDEFELPPDKAHCRHAWHLYVLRLNLEKTGINRDEFISCLREKGVSTSVHFIPIQLHPFFAPYAHQPENYCPTALSLYPRIVSLPLFPGMTEEEVRYVAETAKTIIHKTKRVTSVSVLVGAK